MTLLKTAIVLAFVGLSTSTGSSRETGRAIQPDRSGITRYASRHDCAGEASHG